MKRKIYFLGDLNKAISRSWKVIEFFCFVKQIVGIIKLISQISIIKLISLIKVD